MSAPESGRAMDLQEPLAAMTSRLIVGAGSEEATCWMLSNPGWFVSSLDADRLRCPGCGVRCITVVGKAYGLVGLLRQTLAK